MKVVFFITILLVALNNNAIEALTDKGYAASQIMFYRGIFSFLFIAIFSGLSKQTIVPKYWKPQFIRLMIDGASVWLLYSSYKYLSAGTVALFQRMDIPCLILISVSYGYLKSSLQFYLSIWAILILFFFIAEAKHIDEDPIGFIYALSSVALLSTTYFLIKKQTQTENQLALGAIYSLGMILWGGTILFLRGLNFKIILADLWLFAIGGVLQFLVVYFAILLFKFYTAEKARLPFVFGALLTLIVEMIIEKKIFSIDQIGLSVVLTGIIATICLDPKVPYFKKIN